MFNIGVLLPAGSHRRTCFLIRTEGTSRPSHDRRSTTSSHNSTTLATRLSERLGLKLLREPVEDNPFLERFYEDMPAWAFRLQMFNLWSRAQQVLDALSVPAVVDRSIYEDRLFVELAHDLGVSNAEDLELFNRLAGLLDSLLAPPACVVYLEVSPEECLRRVRHRGRVIERSIDASYLRALGERYQTWIADFRLAPTVIVDGIGHDFRDPAALDEDVVKRIAEHLESGGVGSG